MIRTVTFCITILAIACFNIAEAKPKMKKFKNPAFQFVGSWSVEAYDFREFIGVPTDLDLQLQERAAAFPVGQTLKIDWTGVAVMPGNYNTEKMKFDGPIGETLSITFLTPLEKKLCNGYWDFVCSGGTAEYVKDFMIVEINKWDADDMKMAPMWPEAKHVNYSLVSLSKQHSFDVWVAHGGKLILPIFLDGKAKNGKTYGLMAVILRRKDN
ncbi:hypothetical protein IV454_06295 [Massilia antarctica]|uniref:DUF1579 domain-containing protein n=1 Tax=Massilia antarctica TaxID=2765360 RepID=A0AA49A9Y3_9BURK|nr:hypothetical protein [Massilia antarctica]QPI51140.1 hypothetical protein IV454_06295 [Massilia antarctica]